MASVVHLLVARRLNKSCTEFSSVCTVENSYYYYRVDEAANLVFAVLFGISLIGYLIAFGLTRRAFGFTVAMVCGTILEILGYAGRVWSWKNPWTENAFLIQIVCLTIAPAFMAAGIYLCLRRIVYAFGPENSRIRPESYTRIFIPCDLFSLILQGTGGGIASDASHKNKDPSTGNHLMIAGLALQAFTLLIFILLCVDFAVRTRRRFTSMGQDAFDQNPTLASVRGDWKFKGFLAALALATICIFWRSVYRCAELGEGWQGDLIRHQWLFVGFEGVMVIVACLGLNIFHPAYCFKEGVLGAGGIGARWGKKNKGKGEVNMSSGSGSDMESSKRVPYTGVGGA